MPSESSVKLPEIKKVPILDTMIDIHINMNTMQEGENIFLKNNL